MAFVRHGSCSAAALVAAFLAIGSSGLAADAGKDHARMKPGGSSASTTPYDARFLDTMTEHHRAAIDMAKLAQAKASGAEVKSLAKKIEDDSQQEIKQMQQWRAQWYENVPPQMDMSMPGMGAMKNMPKEKAKLEQTGGEKFDRMFLDQMRKHHENGVKMARDAQAKASRSEVKQLSQKIVAEQTKQIEQMKQMKSGKSG